MSATPGDGMRPFFSSQAAATKGSYNLAGIASPAIDALIEKIIGADNRGRSDHRVPRLRPGVPRRALLGAAMVSRHAPDRLLGRVRTSGQAAALRARRRRAGELVDRSRQGGQGRAGEIVHERLYRPPHPADDPDAARDPVRVLRRGAVRAGRPGRARDRAAHRRRHRRHLADFRRRRRFRRARPGRRAAPTRSIRNIAARRGSIPTSSRAWRSSSASTSRRRNAFALMVWNFARFDFGKSYFRDVSVLQLIKEKLPVSMSLGIWMTLLTYLISIPLGIRKAVHGRLEVRHLDLGGDHRRLCDPGLPVRDPADHPVRRRLVLQHLPAARPDLRRLVAISLVLEDPRLFLAHHAAADLDGAGRRSPP